MADMTVNVVPEAGIADLSAAAAAFTSGDKFFNQYRRTKLVVFNGSGATRTVTIPVQNANASASGFGPLVKSDIVRTVAAGKTAYIGPFEACYEDVNQKITVNIDNAATVTAVPLCDRPLTA